MCEVVSAWSFVRKSAGLVIRRANVKVTNAGKYDLIVNVERLGLGGRAEKVDIGCRAVAYGHTRIMGTEKHDLLKGFAMKLTKIVSHPSGCVSHKSLLQVRLGPS
jgi:hypothetical protein